MQDLIKNERIRIEELVKVMTNVRSSGDPLETVTPYRIASLVDKFYSGLTHNFQLSLEPQFMVTVQFYDEAETINGNLTLKNICTVNVMASNADEAVVKAIASMGKEVRKNYRISAVTDAEVQKLMTGNNHHEH